MHVPDHFVDPATSLVTASLALATVAVAASRCRGERGLVPDDDGVLRRPLVVAGLAATVFASQMVNVPIGAGVSGHLLGGAMLAVLLGPWTAVLLMTAVLGVQALVFGDGGATALGTNIVLLGVVGVAVGWGVARGALRLASSSGRVREGRATGARRVALAGGLGAAVAAPAAAAVLVVLQLLGGTSHGTRFDEFAGPLLAHHLVIGAGEGALTALVVLAVAKVLAAARASARRPSALLLGGVTAGWILVATVASRFASAAPDALEHLTDVALALPPRAVALSAPLHGYGEAAGLDVSLVGALGATMLAVLVAVVVGGALTVRRVSVGTTNVGRRA